MMREEAAVGGSQSESAGGGGPRIELTPALSVLPGAGSVSAKVAEVFCTAGMAFQKLGDLTLQLNAAAESQENMRWSEREVDALKLSLERFAAELDGVSKQILSRTNKHIKLDLKRKAGGVSFDPSEYNPATAAGTYKRHAAALPARRSAAPPARSPYVAAAAPAARTPANITSSFLNQDFEFGQGPPSF